MMPIFWLALAACSGGGGEPGTSTDSVTPEPPLPFEPQPATLHRLTDAQWRTSVSDLLGVDHTGALPVDLVLHGYTTVGASELTIPPLDLELYESAAWSVASQVPDDPETRDALLGCDGADATCIRGWSAAMATRAWRRPATIDELDALIDLWQPIADDHGSDLALQAVIATLLQSPHFLFRVEIGEPDPDRPGVRRYSSHEMAGRLAAFLWGSVPDRALADAAADDALTDTDALLDEAERMLADPRARVALTRFFSETLELQDLDQADKDADLFPQWGPDLRESAIIELERLFEEVVFDDDADFGTLLTTNASWVDGGLAQVYGLPFDPDAGLTRTVLPTDQERGGLLGRVGVLALNAHATVNSPTHRGKFARGRLLCQSIPPPPAGIDASLDGAASGGTLRDRLEQHATDPACSGCHDAMDPLGFALEHFDPIGARRELDNDLPIDATGQLDGVTFDGAAQMGAAIAAHPEFAGCMTLQLYRHATGQAERHPELVEIDALTELFVDDGRRLESLALALVASDAFRTATAPLGDTCTEDGATQACQTSCGAGTQTCADGHWRGCDAPFQGVESCNGADDDCDGLLDERLERSCDTLEGPGTQTCLIGSWGACVGPVEVIEPVLEVCNGLDDDGDGDIDEELEVVVTPVTSAELQAQHGPCDIATDPDSPDCFAAVNRHCASTDCAAAGFGPIENRGSDADVVCLDDTESVTIASTYTELAGHHPDCNQSNRIGPSCNAAISRLCASLGHATGLGPVENYGDLATVVCTPGATILEGSYQTLASYDSTCNGYSQRWGDACDSAMHQWCEDQGFVTGHGPLENSGDLAIIACLGVN